VDYFVAPGQRVDMKTTEAFLERLATLFGRAPEGWRIRYYRHASPEVLGTRAGRAVTGLTDLAAGRIDSARDSHPHELVHAVMGREGLPPVFFAEGLAVALTSHGRWGERDMDVVARREMVSRGSLEAFLTRFTEEDPDVAYSVAGSFVGFLLDRHGIPPMLAFVRACGPEPERYEPAFRRSYGRSLASLSIEWMAWLREREGDAPRAWYEPERWPLALANDTAPADPPPASRAPGARTALLAEGAQSGHPGPGSVARHVLPTERVMRLVYRGLDLSERD
jgi:hypothetical protein